MKFMRFLLAAGLLISTDLAFKSTIASGVDLALTYGSRYVYLGGNHVALSKDPYGPFYNPAQMASVTEPEFAISQMNLYFQYEAPLESANNQRKSIWNWGPLFYIGGVYPINDRITVGIASFPTALQGGKFENVDYGQITDQEYSNMLVRIEVAPSISIRVNKHLSVGGSWRLGYTRFDKEGGTWGAYSNVDSSVSGFDAKGFKIGAYIDNIPGFTFGITYRFANDVSMSGQTNVNAPIVQLPDSSIISIVDEFDTKQDVTLPGQLQVGASYEWIPRKFLTVFTYEYTENSKFAADAPTLSSETNPLGAAVMTSALRYPLKWRDGHTFHMGGEYTIDLSGGDRLRTGLGLAIDRGVTRKSNPNPVLASNNTYYGYAIGANYEMEAHTFGAAFNWGKYSNRSEAADLDSNLYSAGLVEKVQPGLYGVNIFYFGVDYRYRF